MGALGSGGWAEACLALARLAACVVVVAMELPRRERFGWRLAGALLVGCAVVGAGVWLCYVACPALSGEWVWASYLVGFAAFVVLSGLAVPRVWAVSTWAGLNCAAIGYLLHDLSMRVCELLWDLLAWAWPAAAAVGTPAWQLCALVATAGVLVVDRLLVLRAGAKLDIPAADHPATSLALVAYAVSLVAFDVALGSLGLQEGPALAVLSALRATICVALLYLDYQVVCRRALQDEARALEAAAAAHARHYETSREVLGRVEAICHDLLHEMAALVAAGGGGAAGTGPTGARAAGEGDVGTGPAGAQAAGEGDVGGGPATVAAGGDGAGPESRGENRAAAASGVGCGGTCVDGPTVRGENRAAASPPAPSEHLAELERELARFGCMVRTGSEPLDTALAEAGLLCEREGVRLTCVADGAALGAMRAVDAYTLFAALLDEAVEAVTSQDDHEGLGIAVVVRRTGELVSVHVEHPAGAPSGGDTTNARLVGAIARRYGGTVARGFEAGVATVDIMLTA